MNELELIRKLAGRQQSIGSSKRAGVIRGIGDDCAILRVPAGDELLIHTDMTVEDVHFRRRTHTAAQIGAKTLARGLSDVAAMGGTPRWALVSLALPKWAREPFLEGFYDGLLELARRFKVVIVGGDLTRARQLTADIVILGTAPNGKALRRDTAKPGDGIYVSGTLGHAAASKYLEIPAPRLALGRWLRGKASACMDLSDGLTMDLHRLCWESKAAAVLSVDPPTAPGATVKQALRGGEDYELLFTSTQKLPRSYRGLALTRVGTIVRGPRGRVKLNSSVLAPTGWDPFGRK